MRLKSLFSLAAGLLFAGAAVAQDAPPATPVQPAAVTPALTPDNTLNLDLSTGGRVVIQLRPEKTSGQKNQIGGPDFFAARHFRERRLLAGLGPVN